jgi:NAD(P)-dependent dehydrogenase (short-subunit alcohol dehydrogenase family)
MVDIEYRQVALVTGAGACFSYIKGRNCLSITASGLGLALTKRLVEKDYWVAMCDIDATAGKARARELGDQVIFIQADITVYEQLAVVFEQVWIKWAHINFGMRF